MVFKFRICFSNGSCFVQIFGKDVIVATDHFICFFERAFPKGDSRNLHMDDDPHESRSNRGFAFLEVLSPCVTYYDTHREWRAKVYNIDEEEGYDPANRGMAFQRALQLREEGRIPIGRIFKGEHASLESLILNKNELPPAQQKIGHDGHREHYEKFIDSYMG